MELTYAVEESPLGTGGAIRKAIANAAEDSALVLNGDTFLDADYADLMRFHRHSCAEVSIAIAHQDDVGRYGKVEVNRDCIVSFEEKGSSGSGWINAGAYALNTSLDWPFVIGEPFSFERDFLAPQVARLRPAAFKVAGSFLDIGVPEDYDRAQITLARLYP
jgi:D-glycero-alpha-D-manno-heptose 1-phosphate guanylyltransferase